MGMAIPVRYTADMVRALPDDGVRYEAVDGALLVTPSPARAHQRAVRELLVVLQAHVEQAGIGEALASPSDVELDERSLVQPDVYVEGSVDGRPAPDWNAGAPLLLVVEVVSPSSARADRILKRRRYQRARIPEYWIVDLDARTVERWRPDDDRPEVLSEQLTWQPPGAADPLRLDLVGFFARVHREARQAGPSAEGPDPV